MFVVVLSFLTSPLKTKAFTYPHASIAKVRLLKALEREVICRNEAAKIRERDAALVVELRNEFGVGLPSDAESTI